MRGGKRVLVGLGLGLTLLLGLGAPALAHGPQALPGAACNPGTTTAHGSLGPNAVGHDRMPHSHDGGETCVHLNPSVD